MDLIDLEDESIDAEVMDSLAVSMDNFRVSFIDIAVSVYVMFSPFIEMKIYAFSPTSMFTLVTQTKTKMQCYSLAFMNFTKNSNE